MRSIVSADSGITIKFQNFLLICRTIKYLVKSSDQWARQVAIVVNKIEQSFYSVFSQETSTQGTPKPRNTPNATVLRNLVVELCDWSSKKRQGTPKSRRTARRPNKATHCNSKLVKTSWLKTTRWRITRILHTLTVLLRSNRLLHVVQLRHKASNQARPSGSGQINTQNMTTGKDRNQRIGTHRKQSNAQKGSMTTAIALNQRIVTNLQQSNTEKR